ncbi:uncharacterized protein MYCFIDRAFT_180001 [Pseudocercospora fijiensis CIRAD86]|uniref:Uncharacterized protein n=1 Tax=Pseudocercospora fijiensis (strain CIRAD86) TaxID=383855 RepID=M2ZE79_PSEFD|nr:uncharacterized protein MYCFIDRAFT_180001 [Pseudocercospora fijiensis CIRAD86]EME77434.1 hypothetical protein MYCFIDRAFT_180001 [Pseudocercospora fijiensis CIRAD86]
MISTTLLVWGSPATAASGRRLWYSPNSIIKTSTSHDWHYRAANERQRKRGRLNIASQEASSKHRGMPRQFSGRGTVGRQPSLTKELY